MTLLGKALLAQLLGGLGMWVLTRHLNLMPSLQPLAAALLQGMLAATASHALRLPRWWLPIQLLFCPLAVLALRLDISPRDWLIGFLALLLIFWRTDTSRVPLYLSNKATATATAALIPAACAVLDIGCGSGSLLKRLARARPDCRFVGIEHAPLTWLFAWLRCRRTPNIEIRHGDFWRSDFAGYGAIYAFLSPIPMPRLWEKARRELPPGTLLISNSFAIPHVAPERIVHVADRRQTRLYCYRTNPK